MLQLHCFQRPVDRPDHLVSRGAVVEPSVGYPAGVDHALHGVVHPAAYFAIVHGMSFRARIGAEPYHTPRRSPPQPQWCAHH